MSPSPKVHSDGQVSLRRCNCCSGEISAGLEDWHLICHRCGLHESLLVPTVAEKPVDESVNEESREESLAALRTESFETIARFIEKLRETDDQRLLDVGSAHGWFLDAMRDRGFEVTGIEPSAQVASGALARGHRVIIGLFPNDLPANELFDIVSFNDVLEHIPNAKATLSNVYGRLNPGGHLMLSIPSSRGFFYRLSKLMCRAGIHGPFARMWQKDFPSPHLYYFNADVLAQMTAEAGFTEVHRATLPAVRIHGLWQRLTYDRSASRIFSLVIYLTIIAASPMLSRVSPDIDFLVYRRD
jgi:2-polyprenyl-3-methyl-5-hydroxy-6-metoxy-1,4-benzoquinol methylase